MGIFDFFRRKQERRVVFADGSNFEDIIGSGYRRFEDTPEVVSATLRISQLIASETIYLMTNTSQGDVRVINELSRKIDIEPNRNMTRFTFISGIVTDMLKTGNSIVFPHFIRDNGRLILGNLEPISDDRVVYKTFPTAPSEYVVEIDNVPYDPSEVLHFVYNPDEKYRWLGQGVKVPLKDLEGILSQAQATTKGFMQSKWKPSIIVKADANVKALSTKEGRNKVLAEYLETDEAGQPWIIPADQLSVEQIKPLSLNDLAISDTVKLNKQAVAALLGVPAFLLGVGEYKADEWDSFINNTIRPLAMSIEQELTKKLITSPKMYLVFNSSKLYSYDLQKIASVYGGLFDKGIVTGNEVRDKLGMEPNSNLNDLMVLENYIPVTDIGKQKKLNQEA